MKIVHVTNWYIPKMSYQENFLPYEQKLLGHDVEIITSDRFPGYIGNNQNINKVLGKRIITSGVFCDNIKIHRLRTLIEIKDGDQLITWGLKNKLSCGVIKVNNGPNTTESGPPQYSFPTVSGEVHLD